MFILNSNDSTPLYKQLYNQIRAHVLSGKLPANSRLPSVRDLAAELSTSRNTVEGAYQELYAEGYIYSRQRSGYFVSVLQPDVSPQAPPPPRRRGLQPPPATRYRYDFHPARLDPQSFPVALWRKCYLDALRASADELTQYGDPQGDWRLRCRLQDYLERSRGVACAPEQIVICPGLQQSLDLVAQLLPAPQTTVAVEDPGYFLPRAVFQNHGFGVVSVPVNSDGLDLAALRTSGCGVVYVTPSHQLPLGFVMPVAKRLQLIDWADGGGRLIIEDDYDSELRYLGKPIPSLQGLRPLGNIVYLGTFSKVLSPALRMSYLVLPQALLAGYRDRFRDYFATVPLLEQRAMAEFMEQGHWERHVRRMRILYKKKHDQLLAAVARHFAAGVEVVGQGAGLHVVLQLPEGSPGETEILRRAGLEGIHLFPFSATCASGESAATRLMLGFGGLAAAEIEPGIRLLSRLCR